ncbi:MAG TPA: hypothetical protein VEI03_06430 [Stellaceae bacterium]|nr:hypothetical protein [Stellaceae bacterium]
MAETGWLQAAAAGLGGGLTVKVLDIIYLEIRRRFERSGAATQFVDEHLDPLLKSTDELVGKLHALGRDDFRALRHLDANTGPGVNTELDGTMYLFGRFWAQVEIIRREGLSVAIARDERGRRLQHFLDCLESTRVRLIDRTAQRAIGETTLMASGSKLQAISFIDFVRRARDDPDAQRWLEPLRVIIVHGWHQTEKQRLLQFAVVLHSLIDTLDDKHVVTRERPAIPNKLSQQSWRDLNYRVFGRYLTFVKDRRKYVGPPRTGRPRR